MHFFKKQRVMCNDTLFNSYEEFAIEKKHTELQTGGASENTEGISKDPDGCTNIWHDEGSKIICHIEDHFTEGPEPYNYGQ